MKTKMFMTLVLLPTLALSAAFAAPTTASAACSFNGYYHSQGKCGHSWGPFMFGQPFMGYGSNSLEQYIAYLQDLIKQLQEQVDEDQNDDDEPELTTRSVFNITDDSATLRGTVDMNDYRNARVFFIYGEDESAVEDVADDFSTYADIDESGDDLQKVLVDEDLDSSASYSRIVSDLDDNTDIYYSICVEYEDADDDDVMKCGEVRSFETEL